MVDGGGDGELLVKSRTPEKASFGNKNKMWLLWKYVEGMKEKSKGWVTMQIKLREWMGELRP